MTYRSVSFLFTGDAEAPSEEEMVAREPGVLAATVYTLATSGHGVSARHGAALMSTLRATRSPPRACQPIAPPARSMCRPAGGIAATHA